MGGSPEEVAIGRIQAAYRATLPGLDALPARRPAHAAVAGVWILGPGPSPGAATYVLRSRALDAGTVEAFRRETDLVDRLRGVLPLRLPDPLPADDGRRCVPDAETGALWTIHAALPGRIVRPWQALHLAPDGERRALVVALRALHDATRGRLGPPDPAWIVRDVRARLARAGSMLSARSASRVRAAVDRVEASGRDLDPDRLAFVHGDFHWGNLLVADDGRVDGLLDLDWCRVSDPLEDLAYSAMMLVRNCDGGPWRLDDLDRVVAWYGPGPLDTGRFRDLFLLYAFFDAVLFREATGLPDRERFVRLQLDLIARLADCD